MKNKKKILVVFIILLPFIFGFVNNEINTYKSTHTYIWRFDTLNLKPPVAPLDNPMTEEGVELGRLLFYDTLLSKNNKQSCGSCHQQKLSFTDGKKLAIGTFGDTLERNTMTLINLAWSKQFFWDGRVKTLEKLIEVPLFNPKEMAESETTLLSKLRRHPYYPGLFGQVFGNNNITVENVSKAIAQFLRTIIMKPIHLPDSVLNIPPKGISEQDFAQNNMSASSLRGTYFRFANMCGACHNNNAYGFDDGLAFNRVNNENQLMKIPALINLSQTAPYMHDGRFKTLEEVFEHYDKHIDSLIELNPQLNLPLKYKGYKSGNLITVFDKRNAAQFFSLLSDTSILTNKQFSDPFADKNFSWESYKK